MNTVRGFTLIEILIALAVFAILATITSSALYYAFNTKARVTVQADRLLALQLAISLIERNTEQAVNRPIRGNEMHVFPAFVGQEKSLEVTCNGLVNPNSEKKRSTLKRVALLCRSDQLIQRSWNSLDPIDREGFEEKILLDKLAKCQFAYLDQTLHLLPEWRENALDQDQKSAPLPKAIQLSLTLADWGQFNYLFILPKGLYAKTSV